MTNHHDEMRVAPDPSRAEELRQRLHARLASGHGDDNEPIVPIQDDLVPPPSSDTDPEHPEGDMIMLETEDNPTGRAPMTPRRRPPGRWLLVAAAAAVVAVVGTLFVVAGGDDEDPVDTVSPSTTAAPPAATPAQETTEVQGAGDFPELEPGLYFVDPDGDDRTPLRVTYEVAPEGWQAWFGAVKFTDPGVTTFSITTVPNLVSDGCLDHTPLEPPVGPTVDDLATALTQLEPFELTAPPTDVTVLGYPGKHLALTVPDQAIADCVNGQLHSWISPLNGGAFAGYAVPGDTEELWILDVEGTRVVLQKLTTAASPPQDVAERDDIFNSIRIEP